MLPLPIQSRRHGVFGGLSPQTKLQAPPN